MFERFFSRHVSMAKMHMMLLFAFLALWLLPFHIINFRKIEDFKRTTNDTMIPGFLVLNTVTTMSVSAEFGKPYSAAIFGFTGLITAMILVKTYQGLFGSDGIRLGIIDLGYNSCLSTYVVISLFLSIHVHHQDLLMDFKKQQSMSMNRDMMKKKIQNYNDSTFSRKKRND